MIGVVQSWLCMLMCYLYVYTISYPVATPGDETSNYPGKEEEENHIVTLDDIYLVPEGEDQGEGQGNEEGQGQIEGHEPQVAAEEYVGSPSQDRKLERRSTMDDIDSLEDSYEEDFEEHEEEVITARRVIPSSEQEVTTKQEVKRDSVDGKQGVPEELLQSEGSGVSQGNNNDDKYLDDSLENRQEGDNDNQADRNLGGTGSFELAGHGHMTLQNDYIRQGGGIFVFKPPGHGFIYCTKCLPLIAYTSTSVSVTCGFLNKIKN